MTQKINLNRRKKMMILALGVAIPLIVLGAYVAFWPKTIIYSGAQLASADIDYRVAVSEKVLIGTVKSIEVKVVKTNLYGNVTRGEPAVEEIETLYQFVTVDVDKYLVDKTGIYPAQVTFRDNVNGCFDLFEKKCQQHENAIEYKVGEKVLVMLANVDGDLSSAGYVSTYKIANDGKVQNKYSEDRGEPAKKLVDIEQEVQQAIERHKAKQ